MAKHALPQFNTTADIYIGNGSNNIKTQRQMGVSCQLYGNDRVLQVTIRFPKGTTVVSQAGDPLGHGDIINCPAGSSRWWFVFEVFPVATGFPNEFLACNVQQIVTPPGH